VGAIVAVLMGDTLGMQSVMIVGMHMVVLVAVAVLVGVGNTVVGVLVAVGMAMVMGVVIAQVVMIQMHNKTPLHFFFIITVAGRKVNKWAGNWGKALFSITYCAFPVFLL
jgi:hypothetical protein